MSKSNEQIRNDVATAYARRIQSASSCCGGGSPPGLVDYAPERAVTSFGCGNPLAFSGVNQGETVLDLGSGAGLDLLIASDKVGTDGHVIGVDMTDAMLEKARENMERAGVRNVELRKGIIESLPADDASVDWVISNCVINLSPQKDRVFAEIARVLKPGGRFSISDIVAQDLPEWVLGAEAAYSGCVAGAVSEQEYVGGLSAAGLIDIDVSERIVYDADQLCGLAEVEVPIEKAAELAGKVQSIRVSGRRAPDPS